MQTSLARRLIAACLVSATLSPSAQAFDWHWPFFGPRAKENAARRAATTPAVPSPPRAPAKRELSDWELAHCARAAFWQDQELAPLNLQVSVEEGTATVDGPVPSEYLRRKAVALLERLRGIRGVRDNVQVRSTPVPTKPAERRFPPVDRGLTREASVVELELPTLASPQSRPVEAVKDADAETGRRGDRETQGWLPARALKTWVPSGIRAGLLPPDLGTRQEVKQSQPQVGLGRPVIDVDR